MPQVRITWENKGDNKQSKPICQMQSHSQPPKTETFRQSALKQIFFFGGGALCYILKDILMKGKWLMSSHARPLPGLINGKPLSPTPSKEALIITCHLNNILMSAPDSLHFYGILNHGPVWNTSNNEHENAKRFWLTSATGGPEMFCESWGPSQTILGIF